jgi:hypothetical protein
MHIQASVLLAIACAGCAADPTGIRLHIDTDLAVPAELASLRIVIEPLSGEEPSLGLDRTVVPGRDAPLPMVIGIVPKDGDSTRLVRIVITPEPGPELPVPLVPYEQIVRFTEERVVDVFASFPGSCELRAVPGCVEPCLGDDACDDGIVCTVDLCTETGCTHAPDDDLCSVGSCDPAAGCRGCDAASCVAGPCERAECIDDRCVVETLCNDEETCCADACVPLFCDDGDECTRDSCNEEMGCVHDPVGEDTDGRAIDGCPAS